MKEAIRQFKVNVGPMDIKRGLRKDCGACPIARATKRALGLRMSTEGVVVSSDIIIPQKDSYFGRIYTLPKKAEHFIDRFDDGRDVKPFSFVARLVQ